MKKILIADEHFVIRPGLAQIISALPTSVITEEATTLDEVMFKLDNRRYDLLAGKKYISHALKGEMQRKLVDLPAENTHMVNNFSPCELRTHFYNDSTILPNKGLSRFVSSIL